MKHEEILKIIEEQHSKTGANVISVGYGYKMKSDKVTDEKAIVFTVKNKKPKSDLLASDILPDIINIDGNKIKTDVIEGDIRKVCDANFYLWETVEPDNRNTFRPLRSGVSSSNRISCAYSTGTLGFYAIDNDTNSLVGVSNNHVYVDDAFIATERDINGVKSDISGDIVSQKYEYVSESNDIGIVKKYYPIKKPGNYPYYYNLVDVALTTINSGLTDNNISDYVGLNAGSNLPFATTQEINDLLISDPFLYSAGRTSGAKGEGFTKLRITSFPATISIAYELQGVESVVYFTDLIHFCATSDTESPYTKCLYPIASGDSGSALLADINGTIKIIGLCFAGSDYDAFACRIDHVANLLNISNFDSNLNYNYSSDVVDEIFVNGLSDDVSITVSGKTYWQMGIKSKL